MPQLINKLNESADSEAKKWAVVFDFDRDACYPSSAISPSGDVNQGIDNTNTGWGCREREQLDNSNCYYRKLCFDFDGHTYCVHMYALYFMVDVNAAPTGGHRHDWEYALVWTKDGDLTHATCSEHDGAKTLPYNKLPFDNGHVKVVYHKMDPFYNHSFRFAKEDELRAENELHRWFTPTLVDWQTMKGAGSITNAVLREILNAHDFGKANCSVNDIFFPNRIFGNIPEGYPVEPIWKLLHPNDSPIFTPVFFQHESGEGIGGYDLQRPEDRGFAFDYEGNGHMDDLVFYRPKTGVIYILKNNHTAEPPFTAVYGTGDQQGKGIGGYDLGSDKDRVFAFDLEGSGFMDDLVLYRPKTGVIYILKNNHTAEPPFTAVYGTGDQQGKGIGGYDLGSEKDRVFAFDFEGSGFMDDLVLYRPGTGVIYILKNDHPPGPDRPSSFTAVYGTGDQQGKGIGGYNLQSEKDRVFAFDFEGSGFMDDLVLYRPGQGAIFILKNDSPPGPDRPSSFTAVYQQGDPGSGIGEYNLRDLEGRDRVFAFDFEDNGKMDDLVLYRPGTGAIFILQNKSKEDPNTKVWSVAFTAVYKQSDPGNGIGEWDLKSDKDRVFAFDFEGTGHMDDLVLYRPEKGAIAILRNNFAV